MPLILYGEPERPSREEAQRRLRQLPLFAASHLCPRELAQALMLLDPGFRTWALASLYGVAAFVDKIFDERAGKWLPTEGWIAAAVIAGPPIGMGIMYLYAAIAARVGRMMGGNGTAEGMRMAFAWSLCPSLWFVPASIVMYIFLGPAHSHWGAWTDTAKPVSDAHAYALFGFVLFLLLKMALIALSIRNHAVMMGVAHGFSPWRGIATGLLSSLAMLLALLPVSVGIAVFAVAWQL